MVTCLRFHLNMPYVLFAVDQHNELCTTYTVAVLPRLFLRPLSCATNGNPAILSLDFLSQSPVSCIPPIVLQVLQSPISDILLLVSYLRVAGSYEKNGSGTATADSYEHVLLICEFPITTQCNVCRKERRSDTTPIYTSFHKQHTCVRRNTLLHQRFSFSI